MNNKLMIAAALALTLTTTSAQNSQAGSKEWATAGKILTGALAATVVYHAIDDDRDHCAPPAPLRHKKITRVYRTYRRPVYPTTTRVTRRTVRRTVVRPAQSVCPPPPPPVCAPPAIRYLNRHTRVYQQSRHSRAWLQRWCPHTRGWINIRLYHSIW